MKSDKNINLFINLCRQVLYCCLLSLFIEPIPIKAQVITLDSVLNLIERNNPMLKMYDEQINAANNYSQMAKSWMPPTFSTGIWEAPYNNFTEGMWMITSEQMIPNPAKQKASYSYMLGMVPVEQTGKEAKKNEMFSMAKESYYEWIVLKLKYNALVQTDTLLSNIIKVAQIRYTYSQEKLNNVYKAQADLYELRNMEIMMLSDMKMRNIELNTLMNLDKSFVFEIDTTIEDHNYEIQITDTSVLSTARSDIKQFDAKIELIKLQQQYEKSKRLPDFGISLSHMQSLGEMPNQYSLMGMVTIPIAPWSAIEYKYNVQGLNNTANAINWERQSLINETTGTITYLQTQISFAKQQLINYNVNITPAYYKNYQASLLAYEQNTEDLFVVLDGLKMYRMSKMAELDQLNTLLKLQVFYERELQIR